ncbi:hypothetical protein C5C24_04605 [Rathayibacter sp. AY2B3]|uniref:DUF3322 and DUF2220 domain-containing protein n=1 Tax=Rathayibacter sp. AY2B3 TaxID=2080569 RepID=UPI000CE93751|nr:DUF3322 and DUF2220 domain-containing protein [Rathayibacter sp. AY2B3]PPG52491.1 hypothetical protein C5C24_04605 [Rathayibacter sp. AY2B3]
MPSLTTPDGAMKSVAAALRKTWADRVLADLDGAEPDPISVGLRPGVTSPSHVAEVGFGPWSSWLRLWDGFNLGDVSGISCIRSSINVQGVAVDAPLQLIVDSLETAFAVLQQEKAGGPLAFVERGRLAAISLRTSGAILTPRVLERIAMFADPDIDVLVEAVAWLRGHSDLSGWTSRQLPLPGAHSKWLVKHLRLLDVLTGRDLGTELRPRLAVLHLTYVDPQYLESGRRRHDSWTTGDLHSLPYEPRVVVVVENRDCRLWFPDLPGALVIEGGGSAAASLLADVDWLRDVEHVVYWGDIDSRGFSILADLRSALAEHGVPVRSILMDGDAARRFASRGVKHDPHGTPLRASRTRPRGLTEHEREAYSVVATSGPAPFRRIEQERIPLEDACREVLRAIGESN